MNPFATIAGVIAIAGGLGQSGAPADVPVNHWAYPAVDNLFKAGVLKGYPDGTFKGSRPASRYELSVMLDSLMQKQDITTKELGEQIAALRAATADRQGPDLTPQALALRDQIAALKSQIAEAKSARDQVAPLKDRFQELHDQLLKLRQDLDGVKKGIEKTGQSAKG